MAGKRAAKPDHIYTPPATNRAAHRADPAVTDPANVPIQSLTAGEPPTEAIETVHQAGRARHRSKPLRAGSKRAGTFSAAGVTGTIMMIQLGVTGTGQSPQLATAEAAPLQDQGPSAITADPAARLTQARPAVLSSEAPAPITLEPPVEHITPVAEEPAPAPAAQPETQAPSVQAPAPAVQPPAPVIPAPPVAPPAAKGAAILAAARAQLGRTQDCTMLVTNALANVGISFHDWPVGYLSLGYTVSPDQAQPGDLLYYVNGGGGVAHIAVYAGNGMAVHGGWNGNQTVEASATVGYPVRFAPTAYIRVA